MSNEVLVGSIMLISTAWIVGSILLMLRRMSQDEKRHKASLK